LANLRRLNYQVTVAMHSGLLSGHVLDGFS